jgi:hypothetical protein
LGERPPRRSAGGGAVDHAGPRAGIDDCGSRYSSLNDLPKFPLDSRTRDIASRAGTVAAIIANDVRTDRCGCPAIEVRMLPIWLCRTPSYFVFV